MPDTPATSADLAREIEHLRHRLEESEATIRAISAGEVDAFIVRQGADDQVLVLDGVDRPYKLLIEEIQQGAATLTADGTLIYANRRFAELLGLSLSSLIGKLFTDIFRTTDPDCVADIVVKARSKKAEAECHLIRPTGTTPVLITANSLDEGHGVICVTITDLT